MLNPPESVDEYRQMLDQVNAQPWKLRHLRASINKSINRPQGGRLGDVFLDYYNNKKPGHYPDGILLHENYTLDWVKGTYPICAQEQHFRPEARCLTEKRPAALYENKFLNSSSEQFEVWESEQGHYQFNFSYDVPCVTIDDCGGKTALALISSRNVDAINIKGGAQAYREKPFFIHNLAVVSDEFVGNNYCHWVLDTIPRVASIQHTGLDCREYNYIFSRQLLPYQLRTLELLGIHRSQLIQMNSRDHTTNSSIATDRILGFSTVGSRFSHALNAGQLSLLPLVKSALTVPLSESGARNLFINRRLNRILAPSEECANLLWTMGFQEVFLEDMTFDEQVSLFAGANKIIAAHGAALANLIFCKEGTKILEIFPEGYSTSAFAILAYSNKLDYSCAVAPIAGRNKGGHIRDNDLMLQRQIIEDWFDI